MSQKCPEDCASRLNVFSPRFAQWNHTGEREAKQFQHSWVALLKVIFTLNIQIKDVRPAKSSPLKIGKTCGGKVDSNPLKFRRQLQQRNPNFPINIYLTLSLLNKSVDVNIYSWTGGRQDHFCASICPAHP